jgi:hypothetical protein
MQYIISTSSKLPCRRRKAAQRVHPRPVQSSFYKMCLHFVTTLILFVFTAHDYVIRMA